MSIEAEMCRRLHLRPPSPSSSLPKPGTSEAAGDTDEADPSEAAVTVGSIRRVASCAAAVADAAGRSSPPGQRRRVQFADEMGLELARVRLMREPSWEPPVLPWHVIARHSTDTQSDSDADSERPAPELPVESRKLKFKCQFAQPSSKYIVFRETLERRRVALSELHFCGSTAQGSVSVRNLCFDKRVFVRVTFDAWRSFRDVEAVHCGSADSGAQDNFTFSFPCPTVAPFEFCVCFEADNGRQVFWDNNADENYKVSVKKVVKKKADAPSSTPSSTSSRRQCNRRQFTSDFKPNFRHVTQFSKYSAWQQHGGDRVYY